ncbi:MAG: hypothetical protein JWP12_3070 [Bacteroidetes bacterium]|nr:hypothetical protein [Bacteroidota bacterium]
MKNILILFIGFSFFISACKQEPPKLKYNFSVSEYLLRSKPDDADPAKEKITFKIFESFMIDSSVFYYSATDGSEATSSSPTEEIRHSKDLDANDIIALNKIMDSIPSLDGLERTRDKYSIYDGPDYALVYYTNKNKHIVHFTKPSAQIKALFEFGKKINTERKQTKTDSVKIAQTNNEVARDAIRRMPPRDAN